MPYVAFAPSQRQGRLAAAADRWQALLNRQPDLEPAVSLQKHLIGIVVEFTETIEARPLPRLSLPPRYLATKLARGTPALAAEPIPVPGIILRRALLSLCQALADGGAGDVARHIATAVEDGQLDVTSLLCASLARDHHAIRTGASHRGLAPDLVWLAAELAVSPFAYVLQRTLLSPDDDSLRAALDSWAHGYCPACGSWPALAEVASSHRVLRCSFCAAGWELPSYHCIYCGEEGEAFVTAAPDEERKDRRLEVCGTCAGYLKTVDVPALSLFPLLAISDLETMDLDAAAMEHGYSRPTLKDFTSRKPG
jgi:formate dehydrogenase maturation protein FdhE